MVNVKLEDVEDLSSAALLFKYDPQALAVAMPKRVATFPDMPTLIDLYMNKKLNIDGLISRTYKLQDINEGFKRMMAGEVARGVVVFD